MPSAEFFRDLEHRFRSLLGECDAAWARAEIAEVQSYLDAGEYGLAFDTFASIAVEENKPVSGNALSMANDLAERMDMQGSEALRKLRAHAAPKAV